MTRAVANRYVTALAEVVTEQGSALTPEAAHEQLQAFGRILRDAPGLREVLQSPAVAPAEKRGLIAEIGEREGLSDQIRNFLYVVIDHHRIAHFDLLEEGFGAWLDAHRNRVEVRVRVAGPIDADQKAELERRFRDITGKDVRASYEVDAALLGGSLVRVGSTLYDGSLRAALRSLSGGLATGG